MSLIGDILRFLVGNARSKKTRVTPKTMQGIKDKWASQVTPALKARKPSQLRQALITSDKLLDAALKDVVSGENMGQRLKNAKDLFDWSVYDKLWKAHKVRNALVHDLEYEPTYFVLEKAIADFEMGLKELGVSL
ncbi:hypothetical protein GF360_02770 [candidate division WWE3 bacterium]|nr:hypothetical protein [candidate division WWE3 bacterium]